MLASCWWCARVVSVLGLLLILLLLSDVSVLLRVAVEHGLAGGVHRLAQGRWQPMQSAVAQDAAEGTLTTPVPAGLDGHLAGDIVLVVVDVKTQGPVNMVLH